MASDYVISSARKKDLLMPLDKDKLANFGNLNPNYLNQYFDPDNVYSIPYTVGSPMIVYDPDRVEGGIRYFAVGSSVRRQPVPAGRRAGDDRRNPEDAGLFL